MAYYSRIGKIAAALCLLLMFIVSGINKVLHFNTTVKNLSTKVQWWPLPQASIMLTIVLEILGPLIILYSLYHSEMTMAKKASVLALLLFTVLVTIIYHPLKLGSKYMKNIPFFSNLSVVGGLALLLIE